MIGISALEDACRRLGVALAAPTKRYRPLRVDGEIAGWLTDERAERVAQFNHVFRVNDDEIVFVSTLASASHRSDAIAGVARSLADEGALTAWRDERYAVARDRDAVPWFVLERSAARYFGIHTYATHANGLVATDRGPHMWLARRSATKAIDPGLLDNLVGGGIAAGASVPETLTKEAWEEAGIPHALAQTAEPTGAVHIRRDQPDGLHSETIFVHDLWLSAHFRPANQDGEAGDHRLVTLDEAARLIAIDDGPDAITADASLVILDCLRRHGAIAADAAGDRALDALQVHAVHSRRASAPWLAGKGR